MCLLVRACNLLCRQTILLLDGGKLGKTKSTYPLLNGHSPSSPCFLTFLVVFFCVEVPFWDSDICWLKFWKNFECLGQEVLSHLPLQAPSVLVSRSTVVFDWNCRKWSSTVCEGWSVSSVCASSHSRWPLSSSLVFIPRMSSCPLWKYQTLQQEDSRYFVRASSRGVLIG